MTMRMRPVQVFLAILTAGRGDYKIEDMKRNGVLSMPEVPTRSSAGNDWRKEFRAFLRLRRSLLRTHRNRYVAVYKGNVVDSDKDQVALGLRAYAKFGYVPIYVGYVSADPPKLVRVPSPRCRLERST